MPEANHSYDIRIIHQTNRTTSAAFIDIHQTCSKTSAAFITRSFRSMPKQVSPPSWGGGTPPDLKTETFTKWVHRKAINKRRPPSCTIFRARNHGTILFLKL